MPTTRPRHQLTETDELAAALDEAATWWPELSRGQLITRLAMEGHRAGAACKRTGLRDNAECARLIGNFDASDVHQSRALALLAREIDEDFVVNLPRVAEE